MSTCSTFKQELSKQIHFTIFYLPVLTMVLDCRQVVPDYPTIHESMCPARYPKTHAPLVPRHKQDQPITLLSRGPGPCPNLDSKPPHLSPGLSVVLRPSPSSPPISRSKKSQNPRQQINEPLKALVWFWLIDETLSANLVY